MAQQQKKGLIYRLTMGKDNLPDFTPDKLPGTRFQVFKDVFLGRLGAMMKINLLSLIFAIPIVLIFVYFYIVQRSMGLIIPYAGNMGIGYPVIPDAAAIAETLDFVLNIRKYLFLIPGVVIFSVGLSGAFYVARRFAWGEGVTVGSHFFVGIKNNFKPFLFSSIFVAVSLFLTLFNISAYGELDFPAWAQILGMVMSIIQFVLVLSMCIFLTTQSVTYKIKFLPLVKNSFLFAIALLPTNIIMLILSALPFVLLYFFIGVSILNMILIFLVVLFGVSYVIMIWTLYAHWAFDKFVNDKVEGAVKNRGMYKPTDEERRKKEEEALKSKNIRFNNPVNLNKKISSIDEGATYTPLSPTFSRADLEKLAEEKEIVKNEIDAEYGEYPTLEEENKPSAPKKSMQKRSIDPSKYSQSKSAAARFSTKNKKK